jgi:hypothetical protein
MMQAQAVLQLAMSSPGVNIREAQLRYVRALKVDNIEKLLPDPKGPNAIPPMPNPKLQIEQIKAQTKQADMQLKFKLGMMKLMKEAEESQAKVKKLEAEAIKALAEAKGVETGHAISLINAQIAAEKSRHDGMMSAIQTMLKTAETMDQLNQPESEAAPQ